MLDAVMPALLQKRRRSGDESNDVGITRRSKKSRGVSGENKHGNYDNNGDLNHTVKYKLHLFALPKHMN